MQLLWLTDIHLDFLRQADRFQFYRAIINDGDAVVISGDIAEAPSIASILEEMAGYIHKPIYFVLGNHDYYHGQIYQVRATMRHLTKNCPLLFWLGCSEPIALKEGIFLTGGDGWADGRNGDYTNSRAVLNDSRLIAELFQASMLNKSQLLGKMQQLADEDAEHLYGKLTKAAAQQAQKIIVVTHVPPFKETARHEGKMSDDDHLPFFSSQATGNVLMRFARKHPFIEILVLCGHTHDAFEYHPIQNLTIHVGGAEYYQPCAQGIIETDSFKFHLMVNEENVRRSASK